MQTPDRDDDDDDDGGGGDGDDLVPEPQVGL
jgi:hypothetical protein